jgi:hypothetical protein
MRATPSPGQPLEALRRLYEIHDSLNWACLDLIEVLDHVQQHLPMISQESRKYDAVIRAAERAGVSDNWPTFDDSERPSRSAERPANRAFLGPAHSY